MKLYPVQEPVTFGGYDNVPFKKARAVIVPIPYEGTVTYGAGTGRGPAAIIDASRHMETYDIELQQDFFGRLGIYTLEPMAPDLSSPEAMMHRIEQSIAKIVDQKKFPLILGGEHSVTPPAVSALKRKYRDLTVVQFDAHADLRDSYNDTRYSHACAMRRCREVANVVQVGIRSMSAEEASYLKQNNIKTVFYSPMADMKRILPHIGPHVYLTVDLDVLNPAIMPAVGTPEPGGLTWYPFLDCLRQLFQARNVVAADIVELAPIPGLVSPDFMAAVIAYKMLGYKFFSHKVRTK